MTPASGPAVPEGMRTDEQRQAAPDDLIHNALRVAVEVETKAYLWVPSDAIRFVPPLADTIFGDGRALFHFTTINDRPAYWIVRGDSRWACYGNLAADDALEITEVVDEVMLALEEEFGSGRWDEDDDGYEVDGDSFPAIDDSDGCSWGRLSWPALAGIETELHPYAPRWTILTEAAARSHLARTAADARPGQGDAP